MNFYDSFTKGAQRVLVIAQEEAHRMGHNYVGTEHILLGTVKEESSVSSLLEKLGVTYERVCDEIEELVGMGDFKFSEAFGYTPRTKRVLEMSREEAAKLQQNYVGVEHILLALLLEREGVANRILRDIGVDTQQLYQRMMAATTEALKRRGQQPGDASQEGSSSGSANPSAGQESAPTLMQYGRDLTAAARAGELDPVIGRSEEIERIIQILSRRTKNNPVLIGEPGVGKSAVAEGLAQKIAEGNVPELLRGKRIVSLDLAGMLAGAKYRGEFEERMKNVMDELKRDRGIILFIDELHTLIGAGAAEGAIDAANILKPALARGEIQCIGATTIDEYRKHIEKDAALERRFQPVKVEEPSINDAIAVIRGVKGYYEKYHCVRVPDSIVADVVHLSERYITDRYLPDKAIDLLDESCACCNLRHPEITEFLNLQKQVAELETKEHDLENPDPEKQGDAAIDYEELAKTKTELAQLRQKLPALELRVADIQVTADDVAQVVELWTGIPAVKIKETEYGRLMGLEDALKEHIIGQDEAVHSVALAVKRARADLSGRHRPASFIFVGPTGVGKTELVKQLANQLFDTVDPLISIDMSEYMEKYAVSRLIGSPPGYVGYDEAGQLTEKVRRHPYSVVLFDEIEKAHPDVMNILLQILDEGKINDAQGRTVDFSNTVICMTSNAGSSDRTALTGFGRTEEQVSREKSMKALQEFLRPEFLGRVDEVITFRPLEQADLEKIAALMLDEYKPGLEARGLKLEYTPQALAAIVNETSTRFGARELRKTIRKTLEDPVAEAIVAGRLTGGQTVTLAADADGKPQLVLPE